MCLGHEIAMAELMMTVTLVTSRFNVELIGQPSLHLAGVMSPGRDIMWSGPYEQIIKECTGL